MQNARLQVLDAADGARATDWEGQHQSALHTSPLLFDVDYDGIQDILIATYDGDIMAFKDTVSIQLKGSSTSHKARASSIRA